MTDKVTEYVTLGSKMDVPYDGVSPAITSVAGDSIWIYLFCWVGGSIWFFSYGRIKKESWLTWEGLQFNGRLSGD